jgi:hypothetical protein
MQEKSGVSIIGPHPDDQFWIDGIRPGPDVRPARGPQLHPDRWLDGDT